jgi:hypothetical protein
MGYAVFHAEKITASGASLGDHIDRKEGQEHTYRNADPERKDLNDAWDITPHCQKRLHEALGDRIKEGYTGTTAIRKDAVKGLSLLFSGSHEEMKAIEADPETRKKWVNENYKFIAQEFGKENIVRLVMHRDEKTLHLHAVIVPLKDGRLSAKTVLGNPIAMSQRQDRYAKAMEPFALYRGIKGSKAAHNSEGWYVGKKKEATEPIISDLPIIKAIDFVNIGSINKKLSGRFKSVAEANGDIRLESARRERQLKDQAKTTFALQKQVQDMDQKMQSVGTLLRSFVKKELGQTLTEEEKELIHNSTKRYQEMEEKARMEKELKEQRPETRIKKDPEIKRGLRR